MDVIEILQRISRPAFPFLLIIILAAVLNSCSDYFEEAVNSKDQNTLVNKEFKLESESSITYLVNKEFKLESESSITYLAFTANQMVIVEFDKDGQFFFNPYNGSYEQKGNKIMFPLGMPGRTELSEIEFNLGYGILTLKSPEESKSYSLIK